MGATGSQNKFDEGACGMAKVRAWGPQRVPWVLYVWWPCPALHISNTASVRALAEASPQRSASAPGKPPGDKSSTSSSHVACAPVLLPLRAALLLDVGVGRSAGCARLPIHEQVQALASTEELDDALDGEARSCLHAGANIAGDGGSSGSE